MVVRVGQTRSEPGPVNAGAPHGLVLGKYLFNVGTDNLEEDNEGIDDNGPSTPPDRNLELLERSGTGEASTPCGQADPIGAPTCLPGSGRRIGF